MKNYSIRFNFKAEKTIGNIRKVLEASKELGFKYAEQINTSLPIDQAIEEILKNRYIGCLIDDEIFDFYPFSMSFKVVLGHSSSWKRYFKDTFIPDNIRVLNLLLDMTDDFIIESTWINSYLKLLDYPNRKNMIMVNSLLSSRRASNELTDGIDIMIQALENLGYDFIVSPQDHEVSYDTAEIINNALQAKISQNLYLLVDGHIMTLELTQETVSIIAHEPIKMKVVGEQHDYDRAFYLRILLNLLENIGFDELVCTL